MGCASLPIGAITFQEEAYSADATSDLLVKAAVSGKSIYITDIVISPSVAMQVEVKTTTGSETYFNLFFPGTSIWSKSLLTPIKVETGLGLAINATVAGDVDVVVTGYVL